MNLRISDHENQFILKHPRYFHCKCKKKIGDSHQCINNLLKVKPVSCWMWDDDEVVRSDSQG